MLYELRNPAHEETKMHKKNHKTTIQQKNKTLIGPFNVQTWELLSHRYAHNILPLSQAQFFDNMFIKYIFKLPYSVSFAFYIYLT